jgi:CheY-like chemotaxis protein
MRRLDAEDFFERERDALLVATASEANVVQLCHELGDDPVKAADQVRQLLLEAVSAKPSLLPDLALASLPFPCAAFQYPELLPLHRILLVDDDPDRLSTRLKEFRLHQFSLGFAIEIASDGEDAIKKLENEEFDAVFIELSSLTRGARWVLDRLRKWRTPLPPVILDSVRMDVFEVRRLNRNVIRALARGFGKKRLPPLLRKGLARKGAGRMLPAKSEISFDFLNEKKTG